MNKFASNVIQDKFDEVEFEKIAISLKDSGLEKEAQFWSGVKEVGKGLANWGAGVGQAAKEMYQVGKYKGVLAQITKTVDQASKLLGDTLQKMNVDMQKMDPSRRQQMETIMGQLNAFYQQEVQATKAMTDISNTIDTINKQLPDASKTPANSIPANSAPATGTGASTANVNIADLKNKLTEFRRQKGGGPSTNDIINIIQSMQSQSQSRSQPQVQ
jgi:hypothetical protein